LAAVMYISVVLNNLFTIHQGSQIRSVC